MTTLDLRPAALTAFAKAGTDWRLELVLSDDGGVVDLTGFDATFALLDTAGGTAAFTATTGDYLTLGGDLGTVLLDVPYTATAEVPPGGYVAEWTLIEPSGGRPPFLSWTWKVAA